MAGGKAEGMAGRSGAGSGPPPRMSKGEASTGTPTADAKASPLVSGNRSLEFLHKIEEMRSLNLRV